ncbi:hypothetical protein NMG60_11000614 [Bertholletia excelsa]
MTLKVPFEKLHRGLSLSQWRLGHEKVEFDAEPEVADDVKEGHFAMFSETDQDRKRFIVELDNLTNPAFLLLLERAKEEYGYRQKSTLAVPCQPEDLQKILEDRKKENSGAENRITTISPIQRTNSGKNSH